MSQDASSSDSTSVRRDGSSVSAAAAIGGRLEGRVARREEKIGAFAHASGWCAPAENISSIAVPGGAKADSGWLVPSAEP